MSSYDYDFDEPEGLVHRHSHSGGGHSHGHSHSHGGAGEVGHCETGNDYDGNDNMRVLALFIILISSGVGGYLPLLTSRYSFIRLPDWCYFFCKFFGSGVIISTGFIHLLFHANFYLSNACLGGTFAEYPWAFGICIMSMFAIFLVECISRFYTYKAFDFENTPVHSHFPSAKKTASPGTNTAGDDADADADIQRTGPQDAENADDSSSKFNDVIKERGLRDTNTNDDSSDDAALVVPQQESAASKYRNQLISVFILEFGIIFHSVFVGLSLAVSSNNGFNTLFVVLVFHQMFEGMGLGARIAEVQWDEKKLWTPWLLALAFTVTTPIAIAIGIGVRHSYAPESRTALITTGCFDAISAGILIYSGLVELMAHEFLYSDTFRTKNGLSRMLWAYLNMCLGAGLMSLLGKWA